MKLRHWATFFKEDDLKELKNAGITHLRIPVGYWIVDVETGEPFPNPDTSRQKFYLLRLVKWAQLYGLKVLIDLHGAPGSQNGFECSGRRGKLDKSESYILNKGKDWQVNRTIIVLEKLAKMIKSWIDYEFINEQTIYGIELLNEPWGT